MNMYFKLGQELAKLTQRQLHLPVNPEDETNGIFSRLGKPTNRQSPYRYGRKRRSNRNNTRTGPDVSGAGSGDSQADGNSENAAGNAD